MRCRQLPAPSQLSAWSHALDAGFPQGVFNGKSFGRQRPCPSHVSCPEHAPAVLPQLLPTAGEGAVVEMVGVQTKHGLPPIGAPSAMQMPLMRQPLQVLAHTPDSTLQTMLAPHWFTPTVHSPDASSHVETPLHATPSSHSRGTPPQTPPPQVSPVVQRIPSSHATASLADQLVESRSGSQI
jgi:hypothetical protein